MYSKPDLMNSSNFTSNTTPEDFSNLLAFSAMTISFITVRLINYLQNPTNASSATTVDKQSSPFLDLLIKKKKLLSLINDYEGCANELEEKQLASTLGRDELENLDQLKVKLNESYLKLEKFNNSIQDHLDTESSMPNINAFSEVITRIKELQEQNQQLKHVCLDISKRQDKLVEEQTDKLKTLKKDLSFFNQSTASNNSLDINKTGLTL